MERLPEEEEITEVAVRSRCGGSKHHSPRIDVPIGEKMQWSTKKNIAQAKFGRAKGQRPKTNDAST
jgi:hypothetical protein